MKYLFGCLVFIITLVFVPIAFAQDTGWVINSYESRINILETGIVDVVENIEVDYGNLNKHGIFKDIPYVYALKDGNYYTEVEINSVTRDGKNEKYSISKNSYNLQLKIGDPDVTISGQHNYSINFIVRGVLLPYDDFDELYWDSTGTWPVPIESARAIVTLPKDSILQTSCYAGYAESETECESVTSSKSALFSTTELDPNEQMTVAVGFEKGTVPIITVPRPKSVFEQMIEPFNIMLFLLPILGGFAFILHHWYKNGRDLISRGKHLFDPNSKESVKPLGHKDTIVVEYTPPEKLRPAELGVLMDERADTLDVTSTIIDLASRGYFKITEIPKKWLFGNIDYQLDRSTKDTKGLLGYEKLLVDELFDGKKTIKTSELRNKFYSDLAKVKNELYTHVVKTNLFPTDPEKVRGKYLLIGIFLFIAFIFGIIFLPFLSLKMFSAGVVIFAGFFIIVSRSMPRRTAHGQEIYRRAKGYYEFISHVEKYRQQFFERKNMLNEVLPYAIVFGLTGKFAKALKDMGVQPAQPSWYVGHTAFSLASFEKNVNTFSGSLSSAISSAPRSSGSSGGGSSGGGFGGGGGGSW